MSSTDLAFQEADTNNDGYLTENEFRNYVQRNSTVGNDFGSSAYRSSVYESSTSGGGGGALRGSLAYNLNGAGGTGYNSSYGSSSYRSTVANVGNDLANLNVVGDAGSSSFTSTSQTTAIQQYATDEQGNFKDPNPQVVTRPAQGGPLTYAQNIRVRFLQPPPVPAPGPLIIKEVRPPQPPAPVPLRVRQQAPPLPQPPPLVLRERPPPTPATVASQTVVKNLAAIPVPPRSVIIERIPPAPPKPRDIIIERWVPYGELEKRKTIVQRAEAAKVYAKPQNVIIQYESPQVRVVRQFQRLGVTREDPQAYVQRYGTVLLDATTLVQQARAAGVVEDISPPAASATFNTSEFSSSSSVNGDASFETGGHISGGGGGAAAARSSYFESSSYSSSSGVNSGGFDSSFGGFGGSADAAFAAADVNNDGAISLAEFRNAGF